eukprot:Lankesteria_metandrocarpae@DN3290_c0_g1_i1.p1
MHTSRCCPPDGTPVYLWTPGVGHKHTADIIRADDAAGSGFAYSQITHKVGSATEPDRSTMITADNPLKCLHTQLENDSYTTAVIYDNDTSACYRTKDYPVGYNLHNSYDMCILSDVSVLYGKPSYSFSVYTSPDILTGNPTDCARQVFETDYRGQTLPSDYPDGYYYDRSTHQCFATFLTSPTYTVYDTTDHVFGFLTRNQFGGKVPPPATSSTSSTSTASSTNGNGSTSSTSTASTTTAPLPSGTNDVLIISASCVGGVALLAGGFFMMRRTRNSTEADVEESYEYDYGNQGQVYNNNGYNNNHY